ncbi:MAG: hypothetical protein IPP22_13695 [Nitrosomonas sp.]|nr:hypothetical protein [Nitrosomonas sp.]
MMIREKNIAIAFIISAALIFTSVSAFAEPAQTLNRTNDKDAVQKLQSNPSSSNPAGVNPNNPVMANPKSNDPTGVNSDIPSRANPNIPSGVNPNNPSGMGH